MSAQPCVGLKAHTLQTPPHVTYFLMVGGAYSSESRCPPFPWMDIGRDISSSVHLRQAVMLWSPSQSLAPHLTSYFEVPDWAKVYCLLLVQGLTTTDVHYYMAFMLHNHDSMVVAFPVCEMESFKALPVHSEAVRLSKLSSLILGAGFPMLFLSRNSRGGWMRKCPNVHFWISRAPTNKCFLWLGHFLLGSVAGVFTSDTSPGFVSHPAC